MKAPACGRAALQDRVTREGGVKHSAFSCEIIEAEIAKLRSDLKDCTDTQIQEVIQTRIKELRRKLAQLQSLRRGPGKDRAGTRPRPGSTSIIFAERGFVPSTVAQLKRFEFL